MRRESTRTMLIPCREREKVFLYMYIYKRARAFSRSSCTTYFSLAFMLFLCCICVCIYIQRVPWVRGLRARVRPTRLYSGQLSVEPSLVGFAGRTTGFLNAAPTTMAILHSSQSFFTVLYNRPVLIYSREGGW